MDWTHVFIVTELIAAAVLIISLLIWDRHNRRKADADYRALLDRMDQTLERVSDHTRHTAELAAKAAEISARNERLTMAVLQQFHPQGQH